MRTATVWEGGEAEESDEEEKREEREGEGRWRRRLNGQKREGGRDGWSGDLRRAASGFNVVFRGVGGEDRRCTYRAVELYMQ